MLAVYPSKENAVVGSNTLTLTGLENVFVAKWTPDCNKAGIEQFANSNDVSVYPNPASNSLQVSFSGNIENTTIEIYNTIGERVHRQIATSANSLIDVSDLAEGIYNISISSREGVVNKRLVIVR